MSRCVTAANEEWQSKMAASAGVGSANDQLAPLLEALTAPKKPTVTVRALDQLILSPLLRLRVQVHVDLAGKFKCKLNCITCSLG